MIESAVCFPGSNPGLLHFSPVYPNRIRPPISITHRQITYELWLSDSEKCDSICAIGASFHSNHATNVTDPRRLKRRYFEETMSEIEKNRFVFVVCQSGATSAVRKEILSADLNGANLKLAYSQPGFVTFKNDAESPLPEKFWLPSTLTRTCGWSLGKVVGEQGEQLTEQIISNPMLGQCQHVHVFERETRTPGDKGFEPGISELAKAATKLVQSAIHDHPSLSKKDFMFNRVAKTDEPIFDIVINQPNEWWYGYHFATTRQARWPGGVPLIDTSEEKISRAYYKLKEALLWSGIQIRPNEVCAEIGSSPGGACQLLLEMGAKVIAIDPAELEPELLENKNLTYIRRRGREVKKRDFRDVKWLMADLNIAPTYTLDTVEEIVTHADVDVNGMLLTLKIADWKLVDDIPKYIARVKKMGFGVVKTRQLAFNRQEFCLMAIKDKFALRSGKRTSK